MRLPVAVLRAALAAPLLVSAAVTPVINSLSPSAVTAGGAAFTLTVNGSGFVAGAAVQFAGSTLATTFFSPAQVTAFVPAILVAAPGTPLVSVVNAGIWFRT